MTAVGYVLARINLLGEDGARSWPGSRSSSPRRRWCSRRSPARTPRRSSRPRSPCSWSPRWSSRPSTWSWPASCAGPRPTRRSARSPRRTSTAGQRRPAGRRLRPGRRPFIIPVMLFQVLVVAPIASPRWTPPRWPGGRRSARRAPAVPQSDRHLLRGRPGGGGQRRRLPDAALVPFELVGAAAVPLALLALGSRCPAPARSRRRRTPPTATWRRRSKIIVQPVIAYGVGRALRLDDTMLRVPSSPPRCRPRRTSSSSPAATTGRHRWRAT